MMFARRRYRDDVTLNYEENSINDKQRQRINRKKFDHRQPSINHSNQYVNLKNILIVLIILFFLQQLRLFINSSIESIINNSNAQLKFRVIPPTPLTPQKFCRFIPFDRKDEWNHHLPGWEDNIHKEKTERRRKKQLAFESKRRNGFRPVGKFEHSNNRMSREEILRSRSYRHRRLEEKAPSFDDNNNSTNNNNNNDNGQEKDKIYFIHVGKTGGSSLACNIRVARTHTPTCQRVSALQRNIFNQTDEIDGEPAISKYITKRFHMQNPDTNGKKYVISIRNPIERIKSWYLYEHPRNFRKTVQRSSKDPTNKHQSCGQIMLYMCYDTLDDLVTFGLNESRPNLHYFDDPEVHTDIKSSSHDDECKIWAWGAVQGHIAATYHNYWNYEKLARPILTKINQNKNNSNYDDDKQIYVIRTEFLWQDFISIDTIFSDKFDNKQNNDNNESGSSSKLSIPEHNMQKNVNSMDDLKLNVTNKTISYDGLKNLCKALCNEIQIYKQLLLKAVNLNDDDREMSMVKLRESCPDESSIEIRECIY